MISGSSQANKSRKPSEWELRVKKSLEKLTVPDWYVNRRGASPRIISDRRPFESRPAPWKDPARNPMLLKNGSRKETTKKAVEKPVGDNNNDDKHLTEFKKLPGMVKASSLTPPAYSSKTFPKMSPSRKIHNINIVFPTVQQASNAPVKVENDRAAENTGGLDQITSSVDSLDFQPQRNSTLRSDTTESTATSPTETSAVEALPSQEIAQTPRMSCPPPVVPTGSPSTSFRKSFNASDQISSTLKELADTERILFEINPVAQSARSFGAIPKKLPITWMNYPASPVPVTPPKTFSEDRNDSLERSLMEETPFLSQNKSTEMENIIKRQRSASRSFVEEIIQELNSKCSPKVKTTCVTPTSKSFVKKLVQALEMGDVLKPEDEEEEVIGSCSNVASKSEALSVSAAINDFDGGSGSGSDSDQKSTSSGVSSFASFSRALKECTEILREDLEPYVDEENPSVYWIPIPMLKIPRTSSMLSMTSKLAEESRPPSVSSNPGPTTSGDLGSSSKVTIQEDPCACGWSRALGMTLLSYRQFVRIEATAVPDSGYSDVFRTNSLSTSETDDAASQDTETTTIETDSEIGEDSLEP